MSFSKDIIRGNIAEELFLKVLKLTWPNATQMGGYFKDFDIVVPGVTTFEIKYDEVSRKTGNYYIEFEDEGKPSGINYTTAIWWVIYDGDDWCILETRVLRDLIRFGNFPIHSGQPKDNLRIICGYLIPKKILRELHEGIL